MSDSEKEQVTKPIIHSIGQPLTKDHRVYLSITDTLVSPWHDIPLFPTSGPNVKREDIVNMVVEVPRWWCGEIKVAKDDFLTPLKQVTETGQLKYIPNIFPHKGYPWNYGILPQTYSDLGIDDPSTDLPGNGNPLAVCELGGDIPEPGQVKRVKVVGALAVINEGETDWKILVVDVENPSASKLNDIDDVESLMPGYLGTMKEWFRMYKLTEGKKENSIGLGGEFKKKRFTFMLIQRCHGAWKKIWTQPGMKTKVSIADVVPQERGVVDIVPRSSTGDPEREVDRGTAEKSHFLSPNWPSVCPACPTGSMSV